MNSAFKWGVLVIVGVLLVSFVGCGISASNTEVDLRNQFVQKTSERTAFYDNMWKTVAQKSQVALRNDTSFRIIVNSVMAGRAAAQGQFMNWVQEQNPSANFNEVSALYKDLSRTIEAKRDQFFEQEKMMQDIKREHDNLLSKFPSGVFLAILGRSHLDYKPITSDRTDDVIKSGKDNDVNVF